MERGREREQVRERQRDRKLSYAVRDWEKRRSEEHTSELQSR